MKARWLNVFGEEVNLDDIDREYALNILSMHIARKARQGWTNDDFRTDELTQKLREVAAHGRKRSLRDRLRAVRYNARCKARGLSFRAPVR